MDKPLRDLIEIIHFMENVSSKIHGVLDAAEIYRTVKEEFAKSKGYTTSILLLTDDESKLRIVETSLPPGKLTAGEKVTALRLKGYKIDLNKSSIYSQVVREEKTIQVNISDIIGELFPRPLAYVISKTMGYETKKCILTSLKRHGKIIGAFAISSVELAEHFIPCVRNFAQHISNALGLADERAERKRTEKKLKETAELLQSIMDSATEEIIIVTNPTGNILSWNEGARRLLGFEAEEVVGKESVRIFHTKEYLKSGVMDRNIENIIAKGEPVVEELTYVAKGGKTFSVQEIVTPRFDEDGQFIGMLGMARDITERKKAEEALQISEKKFKDLVETTTDWVWEVNLNGVYSYVSPKVKEFLGYEVNEVLGKSPFDFMVDEERERMGKFFKEKSIKKDPFYGLENLSRHKDGHLVVLETNGTPVFDEEGRLIAYRGIDRDITERKKMEKELIQQEKLAAIGRFTAGVAHEINNPLDILLSKIECMQMEGVHSNELSEDLNAIKDQILRMARITQGLLSPSKDTVIEFVPLDINSILESALFMYKNRHREKSILIEKNLSQNLPHILGDKFELEKVFINILNNAVDSIPKKGEIAVTSKIADGDGKSIQVEISDSGVGIAERNLGKIFDPFFTSKEPLEGTGLGLFICHNIIKSHGGSIEVKSQVGEGTTAIIILPSAKKFDKLSSSRTQREKGKK